MIDNDMFHVDTVNWGVEIYGSKCSSIFSWYYHPFTAPFHLFATSLSRLCLTSSFQWNGIGISTCWTYGWLPDLRCIWAGLVDIDGNGVDLLTALFLNCSKMYFFNKGMFSVVGGYGNMLGHGGGLQSDWLLLFSVVTE